MGVHHKVRAPTIALTERHVFGGHNQADDTFLTVARTEFVSDFRNSRLSCDHLEEALLFKVRCEDHTIDIDWLRPLKALLFRLVTEGVKIDPLRDWIDRSCGEIWPVLVYKDITIVKLLTDASQSILVKGVELAH